MAAQEGAKAGGRNSTYTQRYQEHLCPPRETEDREQGLEHPDSQLRLVQANVLGPIPPLSMVFPRLRRFYEHHTLGPLTLSGAGPLLFQG